MSPTKKKKAAAVQRHRTPYTPVVYTQWDADDQARGPGAKQSFKDECDINNIVARYEKTGVLTHLNASQATYADVSELSGYQDALDKVEAARKLFMGLPSELRAQFDNDPAKYLDALGSLTPEQIKELGSKEYGNQTGFQAEVPVETSETADSGESG